METESTVGKSSTAKPTDAPKTAQRASKLFPAPVAAPITQKPAAKAPVAVEKPAEVKKPTTPSKIVPSPVPVAAPVPQKPVARTPLVAEKSSETKKAAATSQAVVSPAPAAAPISRTAATPKSEEIKSAAAPVKSDTVKATFSLDAASAGQVSLCGTFNGWKPGATPMSRKGARWEAVLELLPGRYLYKFVIDGQWIHDSNAQENVYNEHGSLNSVIDVR